MRTGAASAVGTRNNENDVIMITGAVSAVRRRLAQDARMTS